MAENLPATRQDGGYAIIVRDPADLREVVEANVGSNGNLTSFDLDRVRIPTGGALQWTVPTLDGEQITKELRGIIVHWRDGRVFYEHAFGDGPAGPPDCVSNDGVQGTGNPGGLCKRCRYAQWESDPKGGRGQACKQVRLLFVCQEKGILPVVLPLPPTSLKNAKGYFLRLAGESIPFYAVETRIDLEQAQNAGGIKYAKVRLNMARRLDKEELARVKEYATQIKASLAKVQVGAEDYAAGGDEAEISA